MRLAPGPNPPETALAEIYKIPLPGFGIRGMDVDRNGVVWVPLDSGHIAQLRSPQMQGAAQRTGRRAGQQVSGRLGPSIRSRDPASRAMPAPRRTPITSGSTSTTSWASAPTCRSPPATSRIRCTRWSAAQVIELRVPYPMGFFAKGLDGRIDDPNAGWKGRGLWVTSGNRTPDAYRRHRRAGARRARRDRADAVEPAGGAFPAAPRPARALKRSSRYKTGRTSCSPS